MQTKFGTIWHHHPICELFYSYTNGYQRNFATRQLWLDSFLNRPEASMLDVLKELGYEKNDPWDFYPVTFRWIDWESGNEPKLYEIALEGDWNEFYRLVSQRLEIANATVNQEIESWPYVMEKKQC